MRLLVKCRFRDLEILQNWLDEKVLPIFPKMLLRKPVNNVLLVELGVEAFLMESPKLSIKLNKDRENCFIVESAEVKGMKNIEKYFNR